MVSTKNGANSFRPEILPNLQITNQSRNFIEAMGVDDHSEIHLDESVVTDGNELR